jgi:hypothetical protein
MESQDIGVVAYCSEVLFIQFIKNRNLIFCCIFYFYDNEKKIRRRGNHREKKLYFFNLSPPIRFREFLTLEVINDIYLNLSVPE